MPGQEHSDFRIAEPCNREPDMFQSGPIRRGVANFIGRVLNQGLEFSEQLAARLQPDQASQLPQEDVHD